MPIKKSEIFPKKSIYIWASSTLCIMTIVASSDCYSVAGMDLQALRLGIRLILRFWRAKLQILDASAK